MTLGIFALTTITNRYMFSHTHKLQLECPQKVVTKGMQVRKGKRITLVANATNNVYCYGFQYCYTRISSSLHELLLKYY